MGQGSSGLVVGEEKEEATVITDIKVLEIEAFMKKLDHFEALITVNVLQREERCRCY